MPINRLVNTNQSNAPVQLTSNRSSATVQSARTSSDPNQAVAEYSASQSSVNLLQFPDERPKYYVMLSVSDYERKDLTSVNVNLNTADNIILPMPKQLIDHHQVKYSEFNFGPFVGSVINQLNPTNIKNVISGQQSLKDVANPGAAIGGAIGSALGGNLPDQGKLDNQNVVGNAAQAYFGLSPNQFLTILLDGPSYKSFNMQWHLTANNRKESEIILNIIRLLNNSMSPGLALGGAVFSFPKIFSIGLYPNWQQLYRFKPAVLVDFNINYTPVMGPAFHHDMTAESVMIDMQFLELEFWLKGDFKKTGGPYDTNGGAARNSTTPIDSLANNQQLQQYANSAVQNLNSGYQWFLNKIGSNTAPTGETQ